MTTAKKVVKFFTYALLVTLLLLGLVRGILSTGGNLFKLELLIFIIFLALTIGGLVGYKAWGEGVLFWVFLLYLMNILGLWLLLGIINVIFLVLALIGLILALPSRKKVKQVPRRVENLKVEENVHSEVFEPAKTVSETKVSKVGEKEAKAEAEKEVTFTPGKYVASKSSNVYHEPKCDWAKKIHTGRRLWFASKEEAKKKGYRQHSCVN